MPVPLPGDLMVSVSGFRGKVGSCLTPELIGSLAAAFGVFLSEDGASGPVYLGRDSRTSGRMFAQSASAGLVSVGRDVVDLGVAPTPTILLAAERGQAAGALAVTASHNPAEWNALKFAGSDGSFLEPQRMRRFQGLLDETPIPRARWDELGSIHEDVGSIQRHVDEILGLQVLEVERIRRRGFRVAVDCVRGAGGLILPPLLTSLGCEVTGMGLEPDGRFPRDPEPTASNLVELGDLVRTTGSEIGLAVDPDVDRLSLVDADGKPLGEDMTLGLCVAVALGRRVGPVVTNLSTSRIIEDIAREGGAPLVRVPVGEVNVSRRMRAEGAVIGGEGNGGVILPDLHLTRDAPLACALVLQHLVDAESGLREAVARWPEYTIVKEKIDFPRAQIDLAYARLAERMPSAEINRDDGLRLDWSADGQWLHVHPSGTEPVVRLIAEARTEKAAREIILQARDLLLDLRKV